MKYIIDTPFLRLFILFIRVLKSILSQPDFSWTKIEINPSSATYSTNQKQNQNQSRLGHARLSALGAGHVHSLWVLIGSLCSFFTFVVIDHCNCVGFGFTTLNWKPLYQSPLVWPWVYLYFDIVAQKYEPCVNRPNSPDMSPKSTKNKYKHNESNIFSQVMMLMM